MKHRPHHTTRHLVLAGGGHAHLTTLSRGAELVRRGHRVTLIGPLDDHYYSGMGPGLLGGRYEPGQIRFPVRRIAGEQGVCFVPGWVSAVDPETRTLTVVSPESPGASHVVRYDVVSFAIGSTVPAGFVAGDSDGILTAKPIENLHEGRHKILSLLENKTPDILVVGGGAGGVEIAGNACRVAEDRHKAANISVAVRSVLLGGFPAKAGRVAAASLAGRGVRILENTGVKKIEGRTAFLEDGRTLSFDLCFVAAGVKPPVVFRESRLPTGPDGGLLVNEYLQCVDHPEMFGGGDCIHFGPRPLDKVGVYAVRQNRVLFHNLLAALEGRPLKRFDPGGAYLLLLNLGDGTAILVRKSVVWRHRLAFWLKHRIDVKFMRSFGVF